MADYNYPAITSRRNPIIKESAALAGSARLRRERRAFLCEGARLCRDAALSGVEIRRCFFTREAGEKYAEYLRPVLDGCPQAYLIEPSVAGLLSATKHSQGIFCECGWPKGLEGIVGFAPAGPCLVLENIQDPGNLGTILRTAEALGRFRVFLLGDCCDPFSPKALRASMGAVFRLPLGMESDPARLMEMLKAHGYQTYGAVPDPNAVPVTDIDFSRGSHAVLIGNEGSGLTETAKSLCCGLTTIPMGGRAESLNAAAAATVLLWEMARGGGI